MLIACQHIDNDSVHIAGCTLQYTKAISSCICTFYAMCRCGNASLEQCAYIQMHHDGMERN